MPKKPYRILVTGSRAWPWLDYDLVDDAICDSFAYKNYRGLYSEVVVVHGGCPQGADKAASVAIQRLQEWFDSDFFREEIHLPDWKPNGRNGRTDYGAGLKRNQKMVDLGADVCLAFPTICVGGKKNCSPESHYSHGTAHCMEAARKAGIKVVNHGPKLG